MPKYHTIRMSDTLEILGIASTEQRAQVLWDKWSEFMPAVDIVWDTFDTAAFRQSPQHRLFHLTASVPEGCEVMDEDFDLNANVSSLPLGRKLGVPFLTERPDSTLDVDVFLRGADYDTIHLLIDAGQKLILDIITDYLTDPSEPIEQSMSSDDLVLQSIQEFASANPRITDIIDYMSLMFDFTQAETFIALAKLTTREQIGMAGNTVRLLTPTAANMVQDQSSSYDGEVIF